MGFLVLLLALITIFSEDIRRAFNPSPTKTASANSEAQLPEKTINLSDEEIKTYLIKFIKAFYVDQKKGYFDPPSYFTTITDTYHNYHHLTYQQLKTINRERRVAYQKQTLNWLEHTLGIVRLNDTLVVTYWTKQTYIRSKELVRVQADILIELKLTKDWKICSLKEIEVLNLISTPIPITNESITPIPTSEPLAETTVDPPKPNQEASINTLATPDTPPQFKGGQKKLVRFLNKNLQYPTVAEEQGVEGKVFVYFVSSDNKCCS
jgi:hypothetical protein